MFAKRHGIEEDIYRDVYTDLVLNTLDPQTVWDELHKIGDNPIIMCHEDLTIPGEWCHRRMVAEWFQTNGFGEILEWEKPPAKNNLLQF